MSMCGICGIIDFRQHPVSEVPIRSMMAAMKYRGPDDEGVFFEDFIGLGFVRLSILDLSPAGHQPMFSQDGRFVLVYNGEVFNYVELRHELKHKGHVFVTQTDTEVVLAAFREWGVDCLHRFNGMWALALYDRQANTLLISRDRYGIKPFYYYHDSDQFIFASELPALLKAIPQKPQANQQAIFDYLVFNRTDHTEATFFQGIKKLQHGCTLIITDCRARNLKLKIKKWYNLRTEVSRSEGFQNAEEFRDLFSDAVGLRLRSDVPVGVCLSGGLDSSSIVSVILKDLKKYDLHTFSAVYGNGQLGDESDFINEYANDLKNMFYTIPDADSLYQDLDNFVTAHGEPIPSTSPYAQFKVMELARQNVVVTLDGQGADEMLAGYHYFFGFFFKDLLRHGKWPLLTHEMVFYLYKHRSTFGLRTFCFYMLPTSVRTKTRVGEKGYLAREFVNAFSAPNSVSGAIYGSGSLHDALLDHFEFKLEHLLKWEDHNSMWFSLEARVPFLDHRLVEKTLVLPGEQVIRHGMTKNILREAMKGILPEKIRLRRDKVGFDTPQDKWFREPPFQVLVHDILNSNTFNKRNIVDVARATKLYEKHQNGTVNIAREIWKWIHLELWFRKFID